MNQTSQQQKKIIHNKYKKTKLWRKTMFRSLKVRGTEENYYKKHDKIPRKEQTETKDMEKRKQHCNIRPSFIV